MMEKFSFNLTDKKQGDTLLNAINGKGAFRRFKDSVNQMGLDNQWYS
ncbi:hypothetical protein GH741_03255 [Aquibacillus halophilus]|uniref:Uncharacterized protein n=1 Tax=Aquibacillus halophilus TaxID=930132 RepID=A0A6A8D7V8_9BACI|nr:hypothetical protein [Aquibacillus halophilus]